MRKFAGIVESTVAPPTNCLWIKGTDALYFITGKWVSLLAGEGTEDILELAIGDAPEVKTANLAKLKTVQSNNHTFFTNINYGYGTASWLHTTGGNALIITDEGHAVKYSIATNGEVTKLSEFTLGKHTLPKATKTTLGGIKAIINIANLTEDATIAQVAGAVNTLLVQFRNCGLIQL